MSEIIAGILAAGKGTRMGNISLPKPMLIVKEKPMIEKAVQALYLCCFTNENIFCIIGHLGNQIRKHFGSDIQYVEQNILNGNAGALKCLFLETQHLPVSDYLIIQGDDADYIFADELRCFLNFHLSREADLTVLITNKPDDSTHRYEFLITKENRISDFRKRESVDSTAGYIVGTFIFSKRLLETTLPMLPSDEESGKEQTIPQLIHLALSSNLNVFGYYTSQEYVSINTEDGLNRARHITNA